MVNQADAEKAKKIKKAMSVDSEAEHRPLWE